jgi:glycosyltransferase involved in cell wall biosynthesis
MRALQTKRPEPGLVSVVIPVRNGEPHLAEQLAALSSQTYRGRWEVVLANNGSTDQTVEIARRWAPRLPQLRIVDAGDSPSLNRARNAGAAGASGDFLAFCDADDVVASTWLAELVLAAGEADIVSGVCDRQRLNAPHCRDWVPYKDSGELPLKHGFLPSVSGGNCGMWSDVARDLGWNPAFAYGSADIEFSWRAQMAGYRVAHAPDAVLHHRHRPTLAGLARQWFSFGLSGPQLYSEFRSVGMPRVHPGPALRTWGWLLRTLPGVVRKADLRGPWVRVAARSLGAIVGSVRFRVLFLEAPERPGEERT